MTPMMTIGGVQTSLNDLGGSFGASGYLNCRTFSVLGFEMVALSVRARLLIGREMHDNDKSENVVAQ